MLRPTERDTHKDRIFERLGASLPPPPPLLAHYLRWLASHLFPTRPQRSLDDVAAFVRENIAALAASEQEKAKQRAAEHVATVQAAAHVAAQAEARSAVQAAEGTTVADAATSPLHEQPHVADVSMPGDEHAQAAPGGVDGDETEEKKEKEEATGSAGIAAAVAEAVAEVSDVADDTD